MKKFGRMAIGLLIVFVAMIVTIFAPYIVHVQRFHANPADGYSADFYLYVSPDAERKATEGQVVTILVQPNNSGVTSDDPQVHLRDAWWTGFERRGIADELGVVLLVPAFIRPAGDWHLYTHALDRDTLMTDRIDIKRIDLQLIAMIDHARAELETQGIQTQQRILIQGFSASGMFANRFTALHPERVKAASIGSPGGWPIAPLSSSHGKQLPYPVGIADLEFLTNTPFDSVTYNAIPQLIYMGSLDDNDSLDYEDGWDEDSAKLVDELFGPDPLSRWDEAEMIYHKAGASVEFLLVNGIGHDRKKLQKYSTDFFKKVLNGE